MICIVVAVKLWGWPPSLWNIHSKIPELLSEVTASNSCAASDFVTSPFHQQLTELCDIFITGTLPGLPPGVHNGDSLGKPPSPSMPLGIGPGRKLRADYQAERQPKLCHLPTPSAQSPHPPDPGHRVPGWNTGHVSGTGTAQEAAQLDKDGNSRIGGEGWWWEQIAEK